MSYLHTKFHDNWISSFRGVAMTRFWDGRTDGQTDGVDCTPRPAFAFGDAGNKNWLAPSFFPLLLPKIFIKESVKLKIQFLSTN